MAHSPSHPQVSTSQPPVDPLHISPEEWRKHVYQGDHVKQLSVRSIITGMLLGGVMSISNLYVGIKSGWGLGVTITACVLAFGLYRFLETIIPKYRNDPFTILENYTMSSAASAAGYMSSAGLVSAFPALYLTTGRVLNWWELAIWLGAVSVLGVFMAVPLKRQLINTEQLPFPSGIATAETLRSMHSEGDGAVNKARSLVVAASFGGLVKALQEGLLKKFGFVLPEQFPLLPLGNSPLASNSQQWLEKLSIGFEGSAVMLAAGAIMGIRIGISMLLGAIFFYGFLGPNLVESGIVKPGYTGIVKWTIWPSTAMMVAAALTSFLLKWKTILRGFQSILQPRKQHSDDHLAEIEVPTSWFVWGTVISGTICVIFGHYRFDIRWDMGILAVLVTFILAVVAARATGETDVTPIGAMGKITQLLYGVIAPSRITTNLMTASITSGAASHAADLLTDLKTGYLLGGNPRKQTISQLFGVLAGTIFCVPVYLLMVKPEQIGTEAMPFPSAKVWAGVAELMNKGVGSLPAGALNAMVFGGIVGILLALAEEFIPRQYSRWLPSVTGLGIAGVIPAFNSISMFIGASLAWLLEKISPRTNSEYTIAVSSGLIAGESLVGVAFVLARELPTLFKELSQSLLG